MPNVFISYSRKSLITAKELHRLLTDSYFYVWVDYEAIELANDWEKEIFDGLSRCDTIVILVDEYSIKSEWVKKEILYARSRGLVIFPLLSTTLENKQVALETLGIGDIQGIDFAVDTDSYTYLENSIIEASRNNYEFNKLIRNLVVENSTLDTQWTIDGLAKLRDRRAVPYLIKMLQHDEDQPVHLSAIEALGRLEDDRAVPILKAILSKEVTDFRRSYRYMKIACVEALGKIGGDHARETIYEALLIDEVAIHAVEALANFKDSKTVLELSKMLNLSDKKLGNLFSGFHKGLPDRTYRDSATRMREKIIETLQLIYQGTLNRELIKFIKKHAKLKHQEIGAILHVLGRGRIEDTKVIELLKEIALQSNYQHGVRGGAIVAMGFADSEHVTEFLISLLDDATLLPYIAQAFEILGDQRAVPHVEKCLSRLKNDKEYTSKIPDMLIKGFLRDSYSSLEFALYSLGHTDEVKHRIFRTYLDSEIR